MAVVEDFYVGNTRITIDDSSCVSKEESEVIRKGIEDKVNRWLREGTLTFKNKTLGKTKEEPLNL